MSPTPDRTLDPQQLIAELQRQLAESNAERNEAQAQKAAIAEILGAINSSGGDLTPVFDVILEKAHSLCDIAFGSLQVYEAGKFRAVSVRAIAEDLEQLLRQPMEPRPGTAHSRLIAGERFAQNVDIRELANRFPDNLRMQLSVARGLRTALYVPLRKEGDLLGFISAFRDQVRPFSDKEIALLETFAAQAVIAMENARLITETREALERQTATAELLQVINSSPGDLAPVFDAMLEKATRLCEAPFGTLRTWDGERFHFGAVYGDPQFSDWVRRRGSFHPDGGPSPLRRIMEGEQVVQVADASSDAGYSTSPGFREMVEASGMRSVITVALRKDEALFGTIHVYRQEVRPFTDKQVALLQNFAAQAVIAIENTRLISETREALEQQTATAEILQVINSSPGDLAPVFDAMLEKAMHLCEAAFGLLALFDGGTYRAVETRNLPEAFAAFLQGPQPISPNGSMARITRGESLVQIVDISTDEGRRALIIDGGARTTIWVVLRKDGAALGCFNIYRQEVRPFSDKQIALLENFAAQAVIAMENARLLSELRQRTEEVGELNRDLEARVAAQVDELGRVGRLKRFLAPQLAELIVSQGDEKILESHRREIVVVFCDLRGYTAFTETAEPEEVLDFLREYHGALGPLVSQFEGTLDQFSGDGIMVFFNDPVPIPDPAERAVKMAMAMRDAAGALIADWRERGRDLGFGAGIAQGYATLGQIGFSERSGYTAIGTVCNVAARLCAEAKDGQILLSQLVNVALRGSVTTEQLGPLTLKGLTQPVVAYNVPLAAIQPALRVIEGGPQSV
jgi:class 3 adenylate cyclase